MGWPVHIVNASGIVKNNRDEILMVHLQHRGWEHPGGIIDVGENIISGLKREIYEESGIEVEVKSLLGVYSCTDAKKWHDGVTDVPPRISFDFYCVPTGGVLTTSDETSDVRWIPEKEVLNYMTPGKLAYSKMQHYLSGDPLVFAECHTSNIPLEMISQEYLSRNLRRNCPNEL